MQNRSRTSTKRLAFAIKCALCCGGIFVILGMVLWTTISRSEEPKSAPAMIVFDPSMYAQITAIRMDLARSRQLLEAQQRQGGQP